MVVAGKAGVVIVPAPLINVHRPVPTRGVFPAMVAVVPHTVWLGPANDVVGPPVFVMVTCDVEEAQGALDMVH